MYKLYMYYVYYTYGTETLRIVYVSFVYLHIFFICNNQIALAYIDILHKLNQVSMRIYLKSLIVAGYKCV